MEKVFVPKINVIKSWNKVVTGVLWLKIRAWKRELPFPGFRMEIY